MLKAWFFKKPTKKEKLIAEVTDKVTDYYEHRLKNVEEQIKEMRAISRLYPHEKHYDYTNEKALQETINRGYELAYEHPTCKYRVYIKRDRR